MQGVPGYRKLMGGYKRLAGHVLLFALLDAQHGNEVDLPELEPWCALAGLSFENYAVVFYRVLRGELDASRMWRAWSHMVAHKAHAPS
jgi:hypothetical protein